MSPAAPSASFESTLCAAAAEALAAELVSEMNERWRRGDRLQTEDFLTRHPALWQHPAAVADLIYEEISLRREDGQEVVVQEIMTRFPQWRAELAVLLDCQRLLEHQPATPKFPEAGERLGDFSLLAELGRGVRSRVFLARQISLADRPVVLKLAPCEDREDLVLARLQHTNIVPLYAVYDLPDRGLRALCMPYFGSTTLAHVLERLPAHRKAAPSGKLLLTILDETATPSLIPRSGPVREFLASLSFVDAVCWIGICLAEALQHAHERGLVHLDIKPSNILLAADGTPMILDFHLAQAPLEPRSPAPSRLGGTAGYMSPEQEAALPAVQRGKSVPVVVDGRSDVYSLGMVLHKLLTFGATTGEEISTGLNDILDRCLEPDPKRRYPSMAALAIDLRRHLSNLPLIGVRNRSMRERWQKWRRRRPHGLVVAAMAAAVFLAGAGVTIGAIQHVVRERQVGRDLERIESDLRRATNVSTELQEKWLSRKNSAPALARQFR